MPDTSLPDVPVVLSDESIARADEADAARYTAALEFVAGVRTPGSAHWQAVQDRCAEVFEASGFTVERHAYASGVNVIGVLPGTTLPDEFVVVSAHYDHIPGCEGADDNGSGTAGVLEAAQILGGDHLYERTLVVACWDQEESGLIGAEAWTARTARQGKIVHAAYVLETMAFASDEPGLGLRFGHCRGLGPKPTQQTPPVVCSLQPVACRRSDCRPLAAERKTEARGSA
jgi:acetylornithine deacetylase/succinyl-diaminopimelate desuccinylase-like protein